VRQIGTLPRSHDPRIFGDYLLSLGMKNRVDDRPEGWLVWVHNEDHFERAKEELKTYLGAPDDPRYGRAAGAAEAVRRKEAKLEREYRKNFRYVADQWSGLQIRRRPLTMSLVITAVVVFILQISAEDSGRPGHAPSINKVESTLGITKLHFDPQQNRFRDDGMEPIRAGQFWRLVTPIFLHFGILHIVFNCWAITLEGTLIETRKGSLRLAALVLISAILSNLGQYYYMDRYNLDGLHLFGGLSGVGYALFGYLWMKGQYQPEEGMILHPNTITMMLFWLVLCMTGAIGPIANAAHVVGLIVGVAFGAMRL
jgi:GlpG protein